MAKPLLSRLRPFWLMLFVIPVACSAGSSASRDGDAAEAAGVAGVFDFSPISLIVADFIDDRDLNGAGLIIVHRDHGVIYQEHWGDFSESRISFVASSSKMVAAGVLLRLDDDGVLDIDAPVADAVTWGNGNPDITVAQLLSNSSGLVGLWPDLDYEPYQCQWEATSTLQECASHIFNTPDDDDDVEQPDSEFRYGGAQWQVAGGVAETASGMSWAELINQIYVEPCELDALGFNNHFDETGFTYPDEFNGDPSTLGATENPNVEAGMYVTTGDYGKLLLMHLRDGKCGDNQVLSSDALARLHGDRIADAYDGDADSDDFGYGMGWWVSRKTGRISDEGAYGSVPWLDLEAGYGVYLVTESNTGTGRALAGELFDVIDEAIAAGAN